MSSQSTHRRKTSRAVASSTGAASDDRALPRPSPGYRPLSPNEQFYAWLIFGGLLIVGFFFGIVAGYQRPQVIAYYPEQKAPDSSAAPKQTKDPSSPDTSPTSQNISNQPDAGSQPPKRIEKEGSNKSTTVNGENKTPPSPPPQNPIVPQSPELPPPKEPGMNSIMPKGPDTPPKGPLSTEMPLPKEPMANATMPKDAKVPSKEPSPKSPPSVNAPMPKGGTTKLPEGVTPVSFQKDVLPIFRTYCLNCHGAGSGKPKGGVDLRTVAAIKRGGGAPILVVGQPEKSAIYTTIEDMSMPPEGRRPTPQELAIIRNWILTGAMERRRRRL